MAYQTGTATDPADLLDKLRLFALANGFTVTFWGDRPTGTAPRKALHLAKAGLSGAFHSNSAAGTSTDPGPHIGTLGHDAWAGGSTETQPNRSLVCWTNALGGPYQAYHFFSDNGGGAMPYLYVVVETAAGTFRHFGIGRLNMLGAMTTGVFAYGSAWNFASSYVSDWSHSRHCYPFDSNESSSRPSEGTQVRADSDSISPRWHTPGAGTMYGGVRSGGVGGLSYGPFWAGASGRTGRTILLPCLVAGVRTGGLFSLLGAPPNVRWSRLDYLDPGQTITIGTDTWKLFPAIRKNGGSGNPDSNVVAYAYLVN